MNKHCKANAPATTKVSRNDSPIWKRLSKVRHAAKNNMFWTLGKAGLLKLKIPKTQNYQKSKIVYRLKPDPSWVKLNTDGDSKGNPGVAGAGGIVRDYEGKFILAFSEPIGFTNNMVAEMHVVLRGIGICLEKGFSKVWLELDALHVIHLIFRQVRGAWYIQNMLQHIQIYLKQTEVRISHIFREGNQAADYFANQALEVDEISIVNHDQL
ncbi:UNVERIFIED_CONTAM: putative ribonuclease H protein [Sesamum angustifolium]|uniref:Ribonuclease H protein n=1 Tax=Sesamum angustifolium TaxID=2727405 RepID=A0AAW2JC15_9LAMI